MEEKNKEFFSWLFNTENIELAYEEEKTLTDKEKELLVNEDSHAYTPIYFPIQMKSFFESSAMQRLKKVLQLGNVVQTNPYAVGSRYEHCLGAYNLKKNIVMDLYFNNPDFKEMVEKNDLKKYLIAELVKTAGHDIGHLPTSHQFEISLLGEKGFHEYIGRELLTNPNTCTGIEQAYSQINSGNSSQFADIMKEVYDKDIFGFAFIDEGNIDVDRWDYLSRDLVYRYAKINDLWDIRTQAFPKAEFKCVDQNFNLVPMSNFSVSKKGSSIELPDSLRIIPVFSEDKLEDFNHMLDLRFESYQEPYYHPYTQIRERATGEVLKTIISKEKTQTNSQLLEFIENLKKWRRGQSEFDFDSFINWTDLSFYNTLYSCALELSSEEDREKIASILPNYYSLLSILNDTVDIDPSKRSDSEQQLLDRAKRVITFLQAQDDNDSPECRMAQYIYRNFDINSNFDILLENPENRHMMKASMPIKRYSFDEPIYYFASSGKIETFVPPNTENDVITVFWNWKENEENKTSDIVLRDAPIQGPIRFKFDEER